MTSKRRMRAQLDELRHSLDVGLGYEAQLNCELSAMKARLEREYWRHSPKIEDEPWKLRLGNSIADGERNLFSCKANDCPYYWPCPTWHALRRIYGRDDEFELKMVRKVQEGADE